MKFNQLASKEELNKLVKELLKVTNKRYQCNISESELREMLDIQEEQCLFDLTNNYEWLENEYIQIISNIYLMQFTMNTLKNI